MSNQQASEQATRIAEAWQKILSVFICDQQCTRCGQYNTHKPDCPIGIITAVISPLLAPDETDVEQAVGADPVPEWARFEYEVIKVRKDLIPKGGELVEAYETEREIIVIGDPEPEPEGLTPEQYEQWYETAHNCDAMGCGTLSHVVYRFDKPITGR